MATKVGGIRADNKERERLDYVETGVSTNLTNRKRDGSESNGNDYLNYQLI